ncbi:MAG: hypothetical protein ABW046_22605 [Actinoplanes sp.]
MTKQVYRIGMTPLDGEVEAFLRRIGDPGRERPLHHIVSYSVARSTGDVHRITVEFIADAEFDAAPGTNEGSDSGG